jgi:hypothetical protein
MTKSIVINTLVILVSTALFLYLCFSFATWQFYPGEWGGLPRVIAALLWGCFNILVTPAVMVNMKK